MPVFTPDKNDRKQPNVDLEDEDTGHNNLETRTQNLDTGRFCFTEQSCKLLAHTQIFTLDWTLIKTSRHCFYLDIWNALDTGHWILEHWILDTGCTWTLNVDYTRMNNLYILEHMKTGHGHWIK